MKIMYLLPGGLFNSGGMERVITLKANYLADLPGYEVSIVTTEQNGRPVFFPLSEKVNLFHLDIGIYNRFGRESFFEKYVSRKRDIALYKKKLEQLLLENRQEVVISTFGLEIGFLSSIKDGSFKLAELHLSGEFRNISAKTNSKNPLQHIVSTLRTGQMHRDSKKYSKIILLTKEEKSYWKNNKNIAVIPNPLPFYTDMQAELTGKKAIAVGRLCYEKGFDMLIDAWKQVKEKHPDWTLSIFGGGEGETSLRNQISENKLEQHIFIHPPVSDICEQYLQHSFLVMTSRNEAFPMAIVEAMSCGLASVSFSCRSGPKDLIADGENGFLVEPENRDELLGKIVRMIESEKERIRMGHNARKMAGSYRIETVMKQWIDLFDQLKQEEQQEQQ